MKKFTKSVLKKYIKDNDIDLSEKNSHLNNDFEGLTGKLCDDGFLSFYSMEGIHNDSTSNELELYKTINDIQCSVIFNYDFYIDDDIDELYDSLCMANETAKRILETLSKI